MKYAFIVGSLLLFTACATASLTEGGQRVRFVTESPTGCEYLGEIVGHFKDSKSAGIAMNTGHMAQVDLKNKVGAKGGDTVQMMGSDDRKAWGEAYRCTKP